MGKAECFHFVCTKSGAEWTAAPLTGDDQPSAGMEGASAASLDELAKKLGDVVKGAKGETGRSTCNQITPSKALFTATIGGVVAAAVAAAPAAGGAQPAAAAKAAEPEPEEEEEETGDFDLFD